MRKQVGWGQLASSIDAPRGAESSVIAINQKQVFANSLVLFGSSPVSQTRSKFTGFYNKQDFYETL